MKFKTMIKFTLCLTFSIAALLFSFASAITYNNIFVIVFIFGGAGVLSSTIMFANNREPVYIIPILLSSYSVIDVALRYIFHVRLLEFLFFY